MIWMMSAMLKLRHLMTTLITIVHESTSLDKGLLTCRYDRDIKNGALQAVSVQGDESVKNVAATIRQCSAVSKLWSRSTSGCTSCQEWSTISAPGQFRDALHAAVEAGNEGTVQPHDYWNSSASTEPTMARVVKMYMIHYVNTI